MACPSLPFSSDKHLTWLPQFMVHIGSASVRLFPPSNNTRTNAAMETHHHHGERVPFSPFSSVTFPLSRPMIVLQLAVTVQAQDMIALLDRFFFANDSALARHEKGSKFSEQCNLTGTSNLFSLNTKAAISGTGSHPFSLKPLSELHKRNLPPNRVVLL